MVSPAALGLATGAPMSSTRMAALRAVQLKNPSQSTTPANGLRVPQHAVLHWTGRVEETVSLEYLTSGMERDCFVDEGRNYVLKLQKEKWHESSNVREMDLGMSEARDFTPKVYGCVVTSWCHEDVSVLVMELVQDTFTAYFAKLTQFSAEEVSLRLAVGVMAGFFCLVRRAAGDLNYCLADLHWDNVGVSADGCVLILDSKRCMHSVGAGQRVRCNIAVRMWQKSLREFANSISPRSSWSTILYAICNEIARWWSAYYQHLPSLPEIAEMAASCMRVALESLRPSFSARLAAPAA